MRSDANPLRTKYNFISTTLNTNALSDLYIQNNYKLYNVGSVCV